MDETPQLQEFPEEAIERHRSTFNKLHDLEMEYNQLQETHRLLKKAAQLTGSEKQVAWAEKIRRDVLARMRDRADESERSQADLVEPYPHILAATRALRLAASNLEASEGRAAWWIDHRNTDTKMIAGEVLAATISGEVPGFMEMGRTSVHPLYDFESYFAAVEGAEEKQCRGGR